MRIFPTLSVYLGRQFIIAFAAVLLVIMGLILLFDTIELLRRASAQPDADLAMLLTMALMKLPQMVNTILPFAVMIGAMVAFWKLARSHELLVARSVGVSVWQFMAPILAVVFLLGLLNITLINPIAATLFARYEHMEDSVLLRKAAPLSLSQGGLWLRETQNDNSVVVHADEVRQEGLTLYMRGVSVFLYEGADRFARRIDAATGELVGQEFALKKVWTMEPGLPSVFADEKRLPTTLTLSKIQDNFSSPETISFWELPGFIAFFEGAGFSASKHRLHLQSLLASPFLLCAMVLIAAVFSVRPNQRGGGLMTRVASGVAAGFLFYFVSKIIYALGLSATLPLVLAAWSPAMVAGLAGIASLLHLEDG